MMVVQVYAIAHIAVNWDFTFHSLTHPFLTFSISATCVECVSACVHVLD